MSEKSKLAEKVEQSEPPSDAKDHQTPSSGGRLPWDDPPSEMTWGRRIALYMASRYAWYNPYLQSQENQNDSNQANDNNNNSSSPPSLSKAWALFEHVSLERHLVLDDPTNSPTEQEQVDLTWTQKIANMFCQGDRRLQLAEPGEDALPTRLYSPITTPLSQIGDFGLGYGLYFSTLRSFAVLCLVAGILNLPNLVYFASEDYSASGQDDIGSSLLKGSAICTDVSWVPCPDCPTEYEYPALTFSKWSHSTGLHVQRVGQSGTWVNVSSYVNLEPVDHAVREETMYHYYDSDRPDEMGGQVFTADTLAAFQRDFGVAIQAERILFPDGSEQPCKDRRGNPGADRCIQEYCWCQIETYHDCYCQFGATVTGSEYEVSTLGFAEKNNCDGATIRNGAINLVTVIVFVLGAIVIRHRQNRLIVDFDEDEQTAQDYSICVLNPPPDAYDPSEWKSFFEDNFDNCHVAVCTVDVDNDTLVKLLAQRREILNKLQRLLPGVELSRERLDAEAKKDGANSKVPKLVGRVQSTEDEIVQVVKETEDHPVGSVFVTFETETAQRDVLKWLSVGSLAARRNDTSRVSDPRHLFRGKYVLDVTEPEEPSAIRWHDMDAPTLQIVQGVLLTSVLCLVLVAAAFTAILFCYRSFPGVASIVTTVFTSIFPMAAKALMNLETHRNETSRQKWLFIKIATFNILITAVLISVVNPFTATLDRTIESLPGLIPAVHALFFSQLSITPILQLLDIGGNVNRHILGPRAKTQEEMNESFRGAVMFLAERYANLIKFLFLIVWYCAVYPAAFFMGFFALMITYFADRFSLMRTWARAPQVGRQISDFARNYFTPTALVLMAVLSAYAWSGFPYDNLCEYDGVLDPSVFNVTWSLRERGTRASLLGLDLFRAPDVDESVAIPADTKVYRYCLQDFRAYLDSRSFPPLPKFQLDQWMTEDQENLLDFYGWFAVAVLALVLSSFILRNALNIKANVQGGFEPRGDVMGIPFSKIESMDTYLPFYQISSKYPLLLFDASGIHPQLFSWTDPDHPHSHYDITKDLMGLLDEADVGSKHLFARVCHWPPTSSEG